MDSGAEANLISYSFFVAYTYQSYTFKPGPEIITLNKKPLYVYSTCPLFIRTADSNGLARIIRVPFVVVDIPKEVVLGFPWLVQADESGCRVHPV